MRKLWKSFEQGGPWFYGSCQKNLMDRGQWPKGPVGLQPGFGDSHLRLEDSMHLSGLRLTSVFLNRARRVFMASTQCFSSIQATWERTAGEGDQSWQAGGSAAFPSSKGPLPPLWATLGPGAGHRHAPSPNCCVSFTGHFSHLSSASLTLTLRKISPLDQLMVSFQ